MLEETALTEVGAQDGRESLQTTMQCVPSVGERQQRFWHRHWAVVEQKSLSEEPHLCQRWTCPMSTPHSSPEQGAALEHSGQLHPRRWRFQGTFSCHNRCHEFKNLLDSGGINRPGLSLHKRPQLPTLWDHFPSPHSAVSTWPALLVLCFFPSSFFPFSLSSSALQSQAQPEKLQR